MSYATKQDLIDRYGAKELTRLSDRAVPPAGAIDDTVVDQALASADALANSYIAVRVTTPVAPVPLALTDAVCAIARYKLFTGVRSDDVTNDYNSTVKWLAAVGAGTAALGNESAPTAAPSAGAPVVIASDRQFTRGKMRGL